MLRCCRRSRVPSAVSIVQVRWCHDNKDFSIARSRFETRRKFPGARIRQPKARGCCYRVHKNVILPVLCRLQTCECHMRNWRRLYQACLVDVWRRSCVKPSILVRVLVHVHDSCEARNWRVLDHPAKSPATALQLVSNTATHAPERMQRCRGENDRMTVA